MIVLGGLGVQQVKVDALQKIPTPNDIPQLCVCLRMANYYCQFVKDFNLIGKPLTMLTCKDQDWTWGRKQCYSFETSKQNLGFILVFQRLDVTKAFQFHVDRSTLDLGVHLTQKYDGRREYAITYASHSNNKVESNYSSYEGEALAAVWGVYHF